VNDKHEHVGIQQSAYCPGWSGNDTKIGTIYEPFDDLVEEELRALCNLDSGSKAPFANNILLSAKEEWDVQL
jgi:hypothetical protein